MLQNLNEMGAVLVQPQPIISSSFLLTKMLALVQARGTAIYSAEAVAEAERAKTKAVVTDVLSTLNLHTVFPRLKHYDRTMHQVALELLLKEAAGNPTAPVYGRDDVLPLDCWHPQNMDASITAVYSQTVEMTEPQLGDLRTWIYRQYGNNVMTLQIRAIMLQWQVA